MNAQNNKPRCALIGIDGASFEVINRLIKEGRLPNIAALIAKGASGNLESSMPMLSPSVWTTIITGCNPGKHGIYDFLRYDPRKQKILYNSAKNRQAPPLWIVLGGGGKRVCIGGLIMTFPPDTVNGIMFSELVTDVSTCQKDVGEISRSFPPELDREIERNIGVFNMADDIRDESVFTREIVSSLNHRIKLYGYLSSREPFDFRMFYFPETDYVSHRALEFWDRREGIGGLIGDVYERIDAYIGDLRQEENLNIILVSDHGFRTVSRSVSINNMLERLGYLRYRPISAVERFFRLARWALKRFLVSFKNDPFQNMRLMELLNGIDWSRTRAFYFGTSGGTVFINLKDRSSAGIVDASEYDRLCEEIAARMREFKDDETGTAIFKNVYLKKELFQGAFTESAPDICFEFNETYTVAMRKDDHSRARRIVTGRGMWTGDHDKQGIFVASGPHFCAGGQIEGGRAVDVAPTLMYTMGLAIPSYMDGHVLTGAIAPDWLAQRDPVIDKNNSMASPGSSDQSVYSEADEKRIEQRLRDLGYL